jgi:hypothetical protein
MRVIKQQYTKGLFHMCQSNEGSQLKASLQGEALSSRLTIKVIRVLGLSQSDKAVPTSWLNKLNLQKDDEHQGGVAIEINSPEEERVCFARCLSRRC